MTLDEACARHQHAATPGSPLEPSSARIEPACGADLVHGALGRLSVDEQAQQDICAALLSTRDLDARHIEIEMTGAGVRLRGTVAHPEDLALALRIARRLAAPRPVRHELRVIPSSEVPAPRPAAPASEAADGE